MSHGSRDWVSEFRCQHCHQLVGVGSREEIGTRNRNHCPNCLWSVHVGKEGPEDRHSDCGAGMKPIGLTTRADRHGELMIVHECTNDGTLRINRLATDDNIYAVEQAFITSLAMLPQTRKLAIQNGIKILDADQVEIVKIQLFGK